MLISGCKSRGQGTSFRRYEWLKRYFTLSCSAKGKIGTRPKWFCFSQRPLRIFYATFAVKAVDLLFNILRSRRERD
jgi:hypothetical protein